ncbi:immunoglobulin-like domain-containing protein, partial [Motilimonas eburnea]|uniref:immunoglobulin-like domain-containing protein n=1 Tax=Motilimonas eburnea TaxID=1737488 RepID=UPI001E396934
MVLLSVKTASIVSATDGKVFVINSDGSKSLLKPGDKVLPGQKIEAVDEQAFTLSPLDDSLTITDNVTEDDNAFSLPADVESEIAALQQALLAGADPTQLDDFEAPAAGEEASSGAGSSISGGAGISRTGESQIAGSGYDTLSLAVEPPEEIEPIEPRQAVEVTPSVPQTPSIIVRPAGASIDSDNVNVAEGDFAVFSVNVTNALDSSLSLVLADGSAVSSSDYDADFEVSLDGGVSWVKYGESAINLTGSETVLVRIDTTDDAIREVAESFQLQATLTTGGESATAVIEGTIYDDAGEEAIEPSVEPEENDTVFVGISGPDEVTEGETTSPYTIELSQPVPEGKSVTVELAYSGTAQDGSDFNGVVEVVITGPSNSGQFVLSTIDDDLPESVETIVVTVANIIDQQGAFEAVKPQPDGAEVLTNIIDNDATSLVVNQNMQGNNVDVVEGEQATFTVEVGKAAPGSILTLNLQDGSATTADYEANFEVSLDGGQTWTVYNDQVSLPDGGNQTILVRTQTIDDALVEEAETYLLNATLVSAGESVTGTGTATILDDSVVNPPVDADTATLTLSGSLSVIEGESASYTVTVDKAPATDLTVQVITGHITTDNGDVIAQTQDVVIKAGTTETVFAVDTLDDAYADNGEKFQVSLGNTTGGGYENLVKGTSVVETTINDQTGTDGNPGPEDTATISLSGDTSVVEGESASYTVTVDKAPATDVTVQVITGHITTDNGDVIAQTQDVVIKAGTTETVFAVDTLDDAYADSGEKFQVSLGNTTGGGYENLVKGASVVETTINDQTGTDGNPGPEDTTTITLSGDASVVEGDSASYTVSVDKAPATDLTVQVITGHITTDNGDVIAQTQDVVIKAGTTSTDFSVNTLDDAYADNGEKFQVSLGNTTAGGYENLVKGTSVVETTINDQTGTDGNPGPEDTTTITLSGDASVVEGDSASYTVSVDKAPATDLTVQVITGHITTDNGDVIAQTQDVVIKAGTTSTDFSVNTLDDAYADNGEKFQVSLGNTTGGGYENLVKGTSVVETTINDQTGTDGNPGPEDTTTISLSGASTVIEGDAASYKVSVDNAPASDLTVQVITGHITTDNGDLIAQTQDVVIKAGTTETVFTVATLDDAVKEGNEQFNVTLGTTTGGGYENLVKGDSAVTTTITDNDGSSLIVNPAADSNNVSVVEGNQAIFTVEVGKAALGSVVSLSLTDGTATAADYEASFEVSTDGGTTWTVSNGQVNLPNGGNQTILVRTQTIDDAYLEPNETYQLNATLVSGSDTLQSTGTATITDDSTTIPPVGADTATISLSGDASVVEGESASYTVTVDKAPATDLTVQVITGHVTTDNGDVIAQTQDVVIKAGTTETVFAVDTLDDAYADNGEKFQVSLGNTTGGAYENLVKGTSVVETTINDQTGTDGNPGPEDTATISLSGDTSVVEGESASYTVAVDKAPATDLTVQVITGHITTDNGDVIAQTQDVVIKAGTTETVFAVDTLDDAYADNGEQFQVSLGNTTGGGYENLVKGTSVVETTINDQTGTDGNPGPEDTATISLSGDTSVVEGESASYTVTVDKAPATDLTVQVITGHITTDNGDVIAQTQDVVIKAGTTETVFAVDTLDDAYADNGEQFQVSLGNTTGGGYENLVKGTSVVETTINDQTGTDGNPGPEDTTTINLSGASTVIEGDDASYKVSVDNAPASDLTVQVITGHITTDNGDVIAQTQDVVIKAGTTETVFTVATLDDAVKEGNEQFNVTLGTTTGGGYENLVKGNSAVTTTITDNDSTSLIVNPAADSNNVSVVEGNQAIFTVEVGKAALGSVVSLSLTDGTATAADYEANFEVSTDGGTTWTVSNGQVNLPNGGNQTILVRTQTIDDAYLEPNETYQLNATLVSGSDTLQSTGTATITDDSTTIPPVGADTATISLSGDASVVEGESASYTVTVDKAPATDVTVQVITGHITTDNGDVIAQTQNVVIKAGTTETVFAVDTLDDAYADNGEKFQVSLGNTTGGGYENLVKGTSVVETTINDQTGTDGN